MSSVLPTIYSTAEPATNPEIPGARAISSKKSKEEKGDLSRPFFLRAILLMILQMDPPPAFLEHRNKMFDKLQSEYNERVLRKFTRGFLMPTCSNV